MDFVYDDNSDLSLPEQIIAHLQGEILSLVTVDSQRLYCIRDWVYHVANSKASNRSGPWSDLKKAIERLGDFKVSEIFRVLEVETPGGKQEMEFTDEEGLYLITQRMSDRSKAVRNVKAFLAKAGVFMGEAYKDPSGVAIQLEAVADQREYRKLIAEGFTHEEALEWIDVRQKQKETRNILTRIWKLRGIKKKNEYAALTNHVHRIALGRTATRHKRELAVKDSPRNYISAADNAALQITEFTSGLLHEHRNSFGEPELSEDIEDVRPMMDAARPEIEKMFSKKLRRLHVTTRPQLPE